MILLSCLTNVGHTDCLRHTAKMVVVETIRQLHTLELLTIVTVTLVMVHVATNALLVMVIHY